jgi:hypothetical protein
MRSQEQKLGNWEPCQHLPEDKTPGKFCRDGRSHELPNAYWLLASWMFMQIIITISIPTADKTHYVCNTKINQYMCMEVALWTEVQCVNEEVASVYSANSRKHTVDKVQSYWMSEQWSHYVRLLPNTVSTSRFMWCPMRHGRAIVGDE